MIRTTARVFATFPPLLFLNSLESEETYRAPNRHTGMVFFLLRVAAYENPYLQLLSSWYSVGGWTRGFRATSLDCLNSNGFFKGRGKRTEKHKDLALVGVSCERGNEKAEVFNHPSN